MTNESIKYIDIIPESMRHELAQQLQEEGYIQDKPDDQSDIDDVIDSSMDHIMGSAPKNKSEEEKEKAFFDGILDHIP